MQNLRIGHLQSPLLAAFLVVVSFLSTQAQETSTIEKSATPNAELREKAFKLLESLASQVNSLQSAENRARIGSNIAGSLWTHDEKRARALFLSVEEEIKAVLLSPASNDPRDLHTRQVFLRLREDTVERIAKHDPELSLAFLKATRVGAGTRWLYGIDDRERALELRLARDIASRDPDIGLALGRQALSRGFSSDLLPVLMELSRKNKEKAQTLHKEIVDALRNKNLAVDWSAMHFARDLAQSFAPPLADDSTFRDLISLFINTAMTNGCLNRPVAHERAYFCREIASLVPQMEKIDPSRASQIKNWSTETVASAQAREAVNELSRLTGEGTVDDILTLVSRYPHMEGEIYWRAMIKAAENSDLERARKIATDYNGDPERKARMLAQVDRYQAWSSMTEEKQAEVQRLLATIPRPRDRVFLLLQIANRTGGTNRKAALALLNQASGIIDTMQTDRDQTEAQIRLAMMYCSEKSVRCFAIMESLIPKLNELVAAASKLDGYDNNYLRDGEWNMTAEGGVGHLLTHLANGAGYFAWCDFDRAVNLAAQFERTEIRLMAQLKLAQGVLAGPSPRLPNALVP